MLSSVLEMALEEEENFGDSSYHSDKESFNSLPSDWKGPEEVQTNSNDKKSAHHKILLRSQSLLSRFQWRPPKLKTQLHFHLPTRASTFNPKAPTALATKWREKRRIKAMAPRIRAEVERRVQASPFLNDQQQLQQDNNAPVVIGREEVSLQYWLGHGGFCEVWEVDSSSAFIKRGAVFGDNHKKKNKKKHFVLKHLKSALLHHQSSISQSHNNHNLITATTGSSNSKEDKKDDAFFLGAVDLAMEALYLSRIQHPNIIRLYGVVQPSSSINNNTTCGLPYGDGRHDGFGLLLETLSDTLDQRLEEWKRMAFYDDEEDSCSLVGSNHNNSNLMLSSSPSPSPGWLFRATTTSSGNNCNMSKTHMSRVVHYALQLSDALQHLHKHRIVMCDVKPENIGFTSEHTVKLFDFGLCQNLPAPTTTTDDEEEDRRLYTLPVAGTPLYLPGEVLLERKYNCFADVYGWAIVVYQMMTLTTPYEEFTSTTTNNVKKDGSDKNNDPQRALYEQVAKGGARPALQFMVPSAFHSLLEHAWDANVQTRWTMQHVRAELTRIQEQLGMEAPVATCGSTKSRHSRHIRRKSSSNKLQYLDLEVSNSQMDDDGMSTNYYEDDDDDDDDNSSISHHGKGASSMTADDFELLFATSHGS